MEKKDILQLLQDFSIQDANSETYEQRVILDSDFGDIADKILAGSHHSINSDEANQSKVDVWSTEGIKYMGEADYFHPTKEMLDKLQQWEKQTESAGVWVMANERMPGWNVETKWRMSANDKIMETTAKSILGFGSTFLSTLEWLDEAPNPSYSSLCSQLLRAKQRIKELETELENKKQ